MKSTVFLVFFSLILLIKIINGQHTGFYNEYDSNSPEPQSILAYAIEKYVRENLNQNENTAAIPNINKNQMLTQINTPPSSPGPQQLQLPPDLQQQPLQVQQYLQIQKPLQLQPSLQQPVQPTQILVSPLTQPQCPFEIQLDAPPFIPLQHQDMVQFQQPIQKQPQLQLEQPLQTLQPLVLQQGIQSDLLQPLQAKQLQPLECQQYSSQNLVDTPLKQKINNIQPNPKIHVKWKASSSVGVPKIENSYNQNQNIQPLQSVANNPAEIINGQKFDEKPLRYYVLSQSPAPSKVSPTSVPVICNSPSIVPKDINYIKTAEETYVPTTASYNYVTPNVPNQSSNQLHYNNQATDTKQIPYINHNLGIDYPEQFQSPVVVPSQPALVQSQSSVPPLLLTPPVSPQYAVSSGYPVTAIVAPSYKRHNSVSSSLKSIMPLIFQLLKEKIATCACNNDCPCKCKNNISNNESEVTSGYGRNIEYCPFDTDILPVLDTVSDEEQGPECLRETKNCEEIHNSSLESDEILEEQSDEEEVDDDEES